MTQALALAAILRSAGHEIAFALVGTSPHRRIPRFFEESMGCRIVRLPSPNFAVDAARRGIRIPETIGHNLFWARSYARSLLAIRRILKEERIDTLVNFYEPLAGFLFALAPPPVRHICVGHQYLMAHPGFPFPAGYRVDRALVRANTVLTAARAEKRLALSFRPMGQPPDRRLLVCPPLLRQSVLALEPQTPPESERFILVYVLNDGYADEIARWQARHPSVRIEGFWDRPGAPPTTCIQPNVRFHTLDDRLFIDKMQCCQAYVSTAGFESICEAMYLRKPVMVVPTGGHFEQRCNAIDASLEGAVVWSDRFDLDSLFSFLPLHKPESGFREWVREAPGRLLQALA